jgi:hypothetical protein
MNKLIDGIIVGAWMAIFVLSVLLWQGWIR